jgi:hypothetical protein
MEVWRVREWDGPRYLTVDGVAYWVRGKEVAENDTVSYSSYNQTTESQEQGRPSKRRR